MTKPRYLLRDAAEAWSGLRRRTFRSVLSGLGIGMGVVALVAMLSVSEGAKQKALSRIDSLGTRTIRVENAVDEVQAMEESLRNLSQGLTVADLSHIDGWLGEKGRAAAFARKDEVVVTARGRTAVADVLGVSRGWAEVEELEVASGRPLLSADFAGDRVCLAGNALATALQLQPGDSVNLRRAPCQIAGVLRPCGRLLTEGTGLSSIDFDKALVTPLPAFPFRRTIGGRRLLDGIVVEMAKPYAVLPASRQLGHLLDRRHQEVVDFRVVAPIKLLEKARETQQLFALVTGAIAGLSLLVGGIGVMNVMLANIVEQTREIGLRMAVGASRGRIIALYLWQSILLTALGGGWGLLGGVGVAFAIKVYAGWEVGFSVLSVILAPMFAVVTGIVFGVYPAVRAASLEPALALRES